MEEVSNLLCSPRPVVPTGLTQFRRKPKALSPAVIYLGAGRRMKRRE